MSVIARSPLSSCQSMMSMHTLTW